MVPDRISFPVLGLHSLSNVGLCGFQILKHITVSFQSGYSRWQQCHTPIALRLSRGRSLPNASVEQIPSTWRWFLSFAKTCCWPSEFRITLGPAFTRIRLSSEEGRTLTNSLGQDLNAPRVILTKVLGSLLGSLSDSPLLWFQIGFLGFGGRSMFSPLHTSIPTTFVRMKSSTFYRVLMSRSF